MRKNFNILLAGPPRSNKEEMTSNNQAIYAYQQRVRLLNFATVIIKPDIAYATFRLFQYLKNPSLKHITAADQVIAYLYSIKNFVIKYSGISIFNINVFTCASDAAFENDDAIRRNSDSFLFQLYEDVKDWQTVKQSTVITSSTEAKLLAIFKMAKEAIW